MSEREENKAMLLKRGMSEDEVENFLKPGNRVMKINLCLPPASLIDTLRALAKLSVVLEPVTVTFTLIANRREEFIQTAEAASGKMVVDGNLKPGELVH